MVYQNKFVVSIKCNGKFLKEFSDVVYIPFGSEYSIFMKNLDSRRVSVKVTIDGGDVLSGKSIIIDSNSTFELNGFLNSDNTIRNKFKFIEKTEKISNHRGDRIDDGLIRIEYAFEEPIHVSWTTNITYYPPTYIFPQPLWITQPNINTDFSYTNDSKISYNSSIMNVSCSVANECGITTKGSETYEKFDTTFVNSLTEPNVIVIQLKGKHGDQPIKKVIKSRDKIECPICGTKSKVGKKYCPECGTYIFDVPFS